jgi:hypothetical protein
VNSLKAGAGGAAGGFAFCGVGGGCTHTIVGVISPIADQVGFAAFGLSAQWSLGSADLNSFEAINERF